MLLPPDPAWQLPWLRLHLLMRDLLATPWRGNGATIKRELARCVAAYMAGYGDGAGDETRPPRDAGRRRDRPGFVGEDFCIRYALAAQALEVSRAGSSPAMRNCRRRSAPRTPIPFGMYPPFLINAMIAAPREDI